MGKPARPLISASYPAIPGLAMRIPVRRVEGRSAGMEDFFRIDRTKPAKGSR